MEKAVTEAYKNRQTDEFKKYLATDFISIDSEGIKNSDAEIADIQKGDLRNYSFADTKVAFPSADVAVITYKVTTQSTSAGQDTSGKYKAATVWTKRGGKWFAVFHTFIKAQ